MGQEQSPKKEITKELSYEESVTTREQNVSNAVTEFTVFGHSQALGEFSTHTFKKTEGESKCQWVEG